MALADLYVADLKQDFNGQDLHNIFTFEKLDTGTSADLNAAIVEDLLPKINGIQNVYVTNVSLNTICLGNLGDNSFMVASGAGTLAGTAMLPVHDAINYSLKPASRVVRPGSKRFSGIPDGVVLRGDVTDATYITALNALRVALGDNISSDDTNFYQPVVIKRVKYAVPGSDPVRYAYRFPEIGETPVSSSLAGVLVNLHVSHQVSRQ